MRKAKIDRSKGKTSVVGQGVHGFNTFGDPEGSERGVAPLPRFGSAGFGCQICLLKRLDP